MKKFLSLLLLSLFITTNVFSVTTLQEWKAQQEEHIKAKCPNDNNGVRCNNSLKDYIKKGFKVMDNQHVITKYSTGVQYVIYTLKKGNRVAVCRVDANLYSECEEP